MSATSMASEHDAKCEREFMHPCCCSFRAQIAALESALAAEKLAREADRVDAERYRWLRDVKFDYNGVCWYLSDRPEARLLTKPNFDAAIDAARRSKP